MKFSTSIGAALALQATNTVAKLHTHDKLAAIERRHQHQHAARHAQPSPAEIPRSEEKRDMTCAWPSDQGLVYVGGGVNKGWAMSPDQPCTAGNWCQYACPSGTLMTSWNPAFTSYPSKDGGVFCGLDGNVVLPSGPLCAQGATNIQAVDTTGKGVSFCQTVAPGNEAQLIPTWVGPNSQATLAIPKPNYFGKIAAHYYINEPGASTEDSCLWGDESVALGNWATFVGGGLQTADGTTWIDLGLNPKYLDNFSGKPIDFKVEIVCDGECNNPCSYDPSKHSLLEMVGTEGVNWNVGDDGAPYCTTCVTSGSAYYKVSMLDGSDAPSSSGPSDSGSGSGPSSGSNSGSGSSSSAAATASSPTSGAAAASSSVVASSGSSKSNTKGSKASTTTTATATTWSPHILIQESSSTSASGSGSGSGSAPSGTAGVASVMSASTTRASPSSTSSGAASPFTAPVTGLVLTGLAAMLFL